MITILVDYPNIKLQFVFKSPRQLSSLFKFKDCFPSFPCSNVSYRCSDCGDTYYCKRSRNLRIRSSEHLGISKSGSRFASPSPSSIWEHLKQAGYTGSLEDFSIISKTANSFDLLIHESLLIQSDNPSLNSQLSSIPMVLF